jgi:hypothetical protein
VFVLVNQDQLIMYHKFVLTGLYSVNQKAFGARLYMDVVSPVKNYQRFDSGLKLAGRFLTQLESIPFRVDRKRYE